MTKEEIIEELKKSVDQLDSWIVRSMQDGILPIIKIGKTTDLITNLVFTSSISYKGSIIKNK